VPGLRYEIINLSISAVKEPPTLQISFHSLSFYQDQTTQPLAYIMVTIGLFRPRISTLRSLQRLSAIRYKNVSSNSPLNPRWMTRESSKRKAERNETPGPNPSYPAFSFNSLGLGKRTRIVLMVVLSIFGTIETLFWCKAIWQWRNGRRETEQ
jgi:hypothetical protein